MSNNAECGLKIENPTNIKNLYRFCKDHDIIDEDNKFIDSIYNELKRLNYTHVSKKIISTVFTIVRTYSNINYIDLGCAILSFMAEKCDCDNIYINILNGEIGISNTNNLPDNKIIEDLCNNLKQIIIQQHNGFGS